MFPRERREKLTRKRKICEKICCARGERFDQKYQICACCFVFEKRLFAQFDFSSFFSSSLLSRGRFIVANCERASESFTKAPALRAPERPSRELRRFCLVSTRFYLRKIKQIRALDFVEVASTERQKKKRKLVGALCRVLDDRLRFASRGASRTKELTSVTITLINLSSMFRVFYRFFRMSKKL